ncbi:hypothetical protein Goari_001414 [Gossypium aridum]|uniref:Uncharacterized protein n=1 Tax=Gossypium aridum TaxID=34290 RepID=A0A7J8YLE7_GOSAI|nr:hypothetical protein [Gossypium aridum]
MLKLSIVSLTGCLCLMLYLLMLDPSLKMIYTKCRML